MRTLWGITVALAFSAPASAEFCEQWSAPEKIGTLSQPKIAEQSGLAISSQFVDRYYHINDSGDGPFVYITDASGNLKQTIEIPNFKPSDVEDLDLGPCLDRSYCLFVADIGDNQRRRNEIEVVLLEEAAEFGTQATALKHLRLAYPDRAHDAESIAVHPNGDLFLIAKEYDYNQRIAQPAKIFRASAESIVQTQGELIVLEEVGTLDLPFLLFQYGLFGQIATSLDIAPNGKSFLVLTYENAIEFDLDLSKPGAIDARKMVEGRDYVIVQTGSLAQQEALAYLPDGSGFVFGTEFHAPEAELMKVLCRKSRD